MRQNVAGLCAAVALAIVGLVLLAGTPEEDLASIVLAAAGVIGVLCLVTIANELMRAPRD